jgi:uncharacterized RDD family membrane protein YckC
MSDAVRFETPEDVELSFDLAGPGSRAAAAMIDYLIIGAVVFALIALLIGAGAIAIRIQDLFDPDTLAELGGFAIAVLIAAVFGVNLFYFVALEQLYSGQSLGKKLLGLRVVRDGGYAVSFASSLVRNIMRLVDMMPGPYLVGMMSVVLSKERRRLGDFVAGTLVVRHAKHEAPVPRFVGERYSTRKDRQFSLTRAQVDRLGRDAMSLLEGYFDRVEKMDAESAAALTKTIASGIAARMEIDLDAGDLGKSSALIEETYLALREHLAS